jgi:hypothetical protein
MSKKFHGARRITFTQMAIYAGEERGSTIGAKGALYPSPPS